MIDQSEQLQKYKRKFAFNCETISYNFSTTHKLFQRRTKKKKKNLKLFTIIFRKHIAICYFLIPNMQNASTTNYNHNKKGITLQQQDNYTSYFIFVWFSLRNVIASARCLAISSSNLSCSLEQYIFAASHICFLKNSTTKLFLVDKKYGQNQITPW